MAAVLWGVVLEAISFPVAYLVFRCYLVPPLNRCYPTIGGVFAEEEAAGSEVILIINNFYLKTHNIDINIYITKLYILNKMIKEIKEIWLTEVLQ